MGCNDYYESLFKRMKLMNLNYYHYYVLCCLLLVNLVLWCR